MVHRVAFLSTVLMAVMVSTISAKAQARPNQSGAARAKSQSLPTAGPAPAARCDAFAPVFQSGAAWTHQPCSVAICTDTEYNPTSFSLEQMAICRKAGTLHQPQKPRWKTYKAANGEKFEVNMSTIRSTQLGVMAWGGIHGVDVVAQPFIFDCHGHVIMPAGGNGANGPVSTGWILIPPRSVLGQVARDVCENLDPSNVSQYCADFSPAACNRIRKAVNSKVRPAYCKKDFWRVGSSLTEEQVRICSERAAKGIDPMPR